MARTMGIWRIASTALAASVAAALVPLALSALASLPLDRAAHASLLRTWTRSSLSARWWAAVTSPGTLLLSLALIAVIVAWWIWISGHLSRHRSSGTGVVAGIPQTAGRGEHGTSNLMTPA
ncbi:MAG: hypothetical protein L6413_09900, partial [Coriobacteriia bacterium]|nr:hypothetical protein [Coriobacteriia bacterium]